MRIFDSHCHLDDRSYDHDRQDVLARARKAGVVAVMIIGTDRSSSGNAVRLAAENGGCFASVGVHPHDARNCNDEVLDGLRQLALADQVRAWGEIGLDFNRMYSPQATQERWLVRQLQVARGMGKPLIFHERDTSGRFLDLLSAHADDGLRGVIHCFTGSRQELYRYLDLGLCIGITGILTMKRRGAPLREMVSAIPADRLLVETDAPYLTPAPEKNRTRRNEPAFVRTVLLKLAAVRRDDPEILAESLWKNTCRLFGIDV
jgi:TatD DNase family protein